MPKGLPLARLAVIAALAAAASAFALPPESPPPTPRDAEVDVLHGVRVADPFRWLENLGAPKTQAWIEAQQAYTRRLLDGRRELEPLKAQLAALTGLDAPEAAVVRGNRIFILEKRPGAQVASLYEREGGRERTLVDAGRLGPGATIDLLAVSDDARLVAYGVRRGGEDQLAIHFLDTASGRGLPDTLPTARYIYWSLQISPDDAEVYYIRFGEAGPRLYAHHMGAPVSKDRELFGEELGPGIILQANLSADGRWLLLEALRGATGPTDLYRLRADGSAPAEALVKGVDANFIAREAGGRIFVQTDWRAPLGRIMVADKSAPRIAQWRELVPEAKDPLQGFALADGKLLLQYLHDARSRLAVVDATGGALREVALPGPGTAGAIEARWAEPTATFSFTSYATPTQFYAVDVGAGAERAIAGPTPPAWLSKIATEQVWFRSKDGTRVPMFLAHLGPIRRDADNRVLLRGYGGFDWAQTPEFTPEEAAWIENGGVYALANIRGGGEFGEAWHRAGDLAKKQNGFDDFAAAARWLVAHRVTQPDRLAIQGMSNGGLLVLASVTQHPALFAAALARYPLADMLRYERFGIARWWRDEYGSASDPAQLRTLLSYSPYQHVVTGTRYPAVMLVTGAEDTRVSPAHALKMTAALQHASRSGRPVLLLYDSHSGHSGEMPAAAETDQTAHELAFLMWRTGGRPSGGGR